MEAVLSDPILLLLTFSWSMMIIGPATGAFMSLWAFGGPLPPPKNFEDYTSNNRRILRISHLNCFVFPFMNIMWGLCYPLATLSGTATWIGVCAMATSTLVMTIPLFASLKWHGARYASGLGAPSLILGIVVLIYGLLPQ